MAELPVTRASLLVRLRDPKNEAAWREFVALYAPLVYSYVRKQGLQDADAADRTQEVLCAVAGAIGRLEYDPRRGSFRNWLFTVVRRKLSSWRRSERIRPYGGNNLASQQLLEQQPALQEDPAWEVEWERSLFTWACEQVRRDVADLTWQAFWRTAVDGQSSKQAAAALGLTVANVYVARSRVIGRLTELVQSVQEP